MRRNRQGLVPTLIFSVFFLGFIGFFVMQVQRMIFSTPGGGSDPVSGTATVILRERGTATQVVRSNGTSTPRDVTTYTLTGEYSDGDLTRRGKYQVAEDVYFDHEEGSTITIYYYPGTSLSGYGAPPPRLSGSNSSFKNMQQLIGVFMLFVAGMMALGFVRKMLIPAFMGQPTTLATKSGWFPNPDDVQPPAPTYQPPEPPDPNNQFGDTYNDWQNR